MHTLKVKYKTLLAKLDKAQPEKLFLLMASIFCGFFVFLIPPLQGWDEATHFLRAYQISEANFLPDRFNGDQAGGSIPISISDMSDQFFNDLKRTSLEDPGATTDLKVLKKYATENKVSEGKVQKQFEGSAVYTPLAYLPASIGIATARTLHLPLLSYVYLARIFVLVTYLVLIFFAIRLIPVGKWVIFVIALLPQSATLAVSMGSDAFIIGATALLVAFFVKAIHQTRQVTNRELSSMLVLSVALGLMKPPYMLLSLLVACIPVVKFGSKMRYFKWVGGIVLATFLTGAIWNVSVSDITKNVHTYQRPGLNINPDQQIKFIEHEPIKFSAILVNQMFLNTNAIYQQAVEHITWKGIHLPMWVVSLVYLNLILAFAATQNVPIKPRKVLGLSRYGPVLILVMTSILIYVALYVSFNVVGREQIEGVNGRYFTPLILLLIPAIAFSNRQKKLLVLNHEKVKQYFVISTLFILIFTCSVIMSANYIPDI